MPDPLYGVLYQSWPQSDGSLKLEFLSAGAEGLLEATADEVAARLGDGTFPLCGVDANEFYRRIGRSVADHSAWHAEFGYVRPRSGDVRWFRGQDFPRRTPEGLPFFSGVLIDITGSKRAEEESRRAYQELSAHLNHTPLAVVEWDHEARVRRWSGSAEAMFGWTADEVLGRALHEFPLVHPDDAARVDGIAADLLSQKVAGNVCRNRNLHKSGRVVHCVWHNSAHLDSEGRLRSILAMAQDLTEQVAIEEELTLSDERLRTSLRFAGMLSWDYDVRTASMVYSQDVREFFGMPDLPPGADLEFGMAHPDDRDRLMAEVRAAAGTLSDFHLQYRGARPDAQGRTPWFSTRGSFVATSDGALARVLGVTSNITHRKRIEQERAALDDELREARHLESLGLLAGGVAHDFNNLLTIILGNAGLLRMIAGADAPVDKSVAEIETACQRAADLCSQITAYAGVGRLLATEFDLGPLLRDAEEGFGTLVGPRVALTWELEPRPSLIVGEARQIRQAVGNILSNAAEALGERGGAVVLRTERRSFAEIPAGWSPSVPPGEYVLVRIADDGPGMAEQVRARAFEAFFSTRFTGRGLGLAAVHGIVRSHKGGVRILSAAGAGTTVELLLPVKKEAAGGHPGVAAVPAAVGTAGRSPGDARPALHPPTHRRLRPARPARRLPLRPGDPRGAAPPRRRDRAHHRLPHPAGPGRRRGGGRAAHRVRRGGLPPLRQRRAPPPPRLPSMRRGRRDRGPRGGDVGPQRGRTARLLRPLTHRRDLRAVPGVRNVSDRHGRSGHRALASAR